LQRAFGLSLYAQGQTEQAIGYLNKTVALGADRPGDELMDVYYALGGCYFAAQDYEQAIRFYGQAQELDPEGRSVWAGEARDNLDTIHVENAMRDILLDLDFSNVATEGGETYAIAKTGQKVEIRGPVRLLEGPWEGAQALVVEEGTTNLIQNPSAEADGWWILKGWNDGLAPVRSNGWARCGSHSWKLGNSVAGNTGFEVDLSDLVPLDDYTISFDFNFDTDVTSGGYVAFYDSGTWQQQDVVPFDPINAGHGRLAFTLTPTTDNPTLRLAFVPVSSGNNYVDCIQLEHKSYATSYSDGDQGGGYFWSGPAYAGTSVRAATQLTTSVADVMNASGGSVAVWIRPLHASGSVTRTNPGLFRWWEGWNTESMYVEFNTDYSMIGFRSYVNSVKQGSLDADVTWDTETWHFLVFTWDDLNHERKSYIDGEQRDSGTYSAPSIVSSTVAWGWTLAGREVNGSLALIATFDRALTPDEVAALYKVGDSADK